MTAQERITELDGANEKLSAEVSSLRDALAKSEENAHTAQARAEEIERRADELRIELDRAHGEAVAIRASLAEQTAALRVAQDAVTVADAEKRSLLEAGAEERARFANELAAVRADAATAREDAARKSGELDALRVQSAALLDALKKPAEASAPTDTSAKSARKSSAQDKK